MIYKIKNNLEILLEFLEPLLPFSNCHMVDFFCENNYQNFISTNIQQEVDKLGLEQSLNFIFNHKESNTNHLASFLLKSKTLSNLTDICLSLNEFQLKLINLGCKNLSGLRLDIFMTSKKSHEVEILSEISTAVSEIAKTEYLVDIGDGRGYLSSALALHSNLKVLGIDSSQINTKSAEKRANKLKKVLKSNISENYKQVTSFVTEDADLTSLLRQCYHNDKINTLSLIGLHTCGDLAKSCLKIYVNNNNIDSVCNVGCCYHLISENNFPMSNYLKERGFKLSRNSKMLSCQSLSRILYYKELPSKALFYRALLQILLKKYYPNLVNCHVGKLKKLTTFLNYVESAFKKFNTNLTIPETEINYLYESYSEQEKYLNLFYLIRAHLAPVIESVIILDRLLFLHEQNLNYSYLVQLFDPVISPRCYGIISFKNTCFDV